MAARLKRSRSSRRGQPPSAVRRGKAPPALECIHANETPGDMRLPGATGGRLFLHSALGFHTILRGVNVEKILLRETRDCQFSLFDYADSNAGKRGIDLIPPRP